jgi:hypothetical protein
MTDLTWRLTAGTQHGKADDINAKNQYSWVKSSHKILPKALDAFIRHSTTTSSETLSAA